MSESVDITRRAKSNLAFALLDMPEEKKRSMEQFYAFCRVIDDIVDEPGMEPDERHAALDRWVEVVHRAVVPADGIEQEVHELLEKLNPDIEPMLELIEGCRGDIAPVQPETRAELLQYSYRVASCVGITSACVMGASSAAHDYAVALGHALQFVNIIRDVGEDCSKHGRVYLPADDMELFGVSLEDLEKGVCDYRLQTLLAYEAVLAKRFFAEADDLYSKLSTEDRSALIPAQAMSLIYHTILDKMEADEYQIFAKRYRVNSVRKLWLMLRARLGTVEMPSISLPSISLNLPSLADLGFGKDKEKSDAGGKKNPPGGAA
ncbi:phytoene/squalene synthase family protein [Akkermansia glycaniphila]|uniref:phytoene/squalene synthase family protein n=1 Tax=Akkermansia glycaniphila TaxID=1679444 RepID=UPI001C015971|nr:phytoene/squalene synthase family protein [Akkermansia glycaniphila]MBT9450231.1 phytoene/squalene synthase family protein [Akkermansia glycaniphila]